MFGRKRKKKPQTDQALLGDALSDLLHDQQVKEKRKRRRQRLRWPEWLDKRVAIGLAVVLAVIIGDAVRRENQEFYAVVTQTSGVVTISTRDLPQARAPQLNEKLPDYSNVKTGPNSWAELSFPDGSKIVLDANADLRIKLLEYHRGGKWRSRSLLLNSGRLIARIAENFGKDSELRVYTPACVAAARGTRFSVTADADGAARTVVGDGVVEVKGFTGTRMFVRDKGDCSAKAGGNPTQPTYAPASDLSLFRSRSMVQIVRTDPWYKQAELTITQTLDAPLTILGIGKCSWALGAADFVRRTNCQEALRKIHANLEGDPVYPLWVNPATLKELSIQEQGGVENILKSFDGAAIESFWSDGRRFQITARGRDRHKTRYQLDAAGVRKAENQD
jgi:hypothetical protein